MSTCPERDVHSLYLDCELPQKYVKDYEAHVASCEKCQKILQNYRRTRELLKPEDAMLLMTSDELEASFESLQTKMHFRKNTLLIQQENRSFRWAVPSFTTVAAAVMAFFLIFPFGATKEEMAVPVSTERPIQIAASALGGHLSTVAAPSISSQQDSFLSQQPVIISKDSQYGEFVSNTGMRPSVSALDVLNFAFQDDTKSILMELQLSNISNINSFYGTVLPSALFLNIVGQ